MKKLVRIAIGLLIAASATDTVLAAAQRGNAQAARRLVLPVLTLPASGTFALGGEFDGRISINRFERRGTAIVAIGLVSGVLSRDSQILGTAVGGEIAWPVAVSTGGLSVVSGRPPAASTVTRVAWSPDAPLLRVQAESCPVLNISLAPVTVDLLGVQVALSPITLDLTGLAGTPLGDLVCEASDLLGNVAALVNLLNSILGLVTGLLGGLLGGIGGALP